MSQKEIFENHASNLGKLIGNLLTIEMAARLAIVSLDEHVASQVSTQLPQVKKGEYVECNAFTNSDDLRQTLGKYNKRAPLDCKIDIDPIVDLRDVLAHGRMFGSGSIGHLRLLKFNRKQKAGKVSVDLAVIMTPAWFSENIELLTKAIEKITTSLAYEIKVLE